MARPRTDNVVVLMRMGQGNGPAYLIPLANAIQPARLRVIRPACKPPALTVQNHDYVDVSGGTNAWEVIKVSVRGLIDVLRLRPALLASFNAYPYGIIAFLIGWLTRTPAHIGFVGSDIQRLRKIPPILRLLSTAALITAPGPTTVRLLTDAGVSADVHTLTHGVDRKRFFDPGGSRDIDIVYVGALIPRKRVDLLIEALRILQEEGHRARSVTIVGDGEERTSLKDLTRLYGLDQIEFVGQQAHPEQWLSRAKLLVMPSAWEGLAFALVEAMRCEVVPVVTDVASTRDLVQHGYNGVLLDPTSGPKAIAEAIRKLLDDSDTRECLSRTAIETTDEFTYERTEREWRMMLGEPHGQS